MKDKAARALPVLQAILAKYPFQYFDPSDKDLESAGKLTEAKDIHVVAAAMTAECQYIISHDRAHLVGNTKIEEATGIRVVTPGDMLAIIRESMTQHASAESEPDEAEPAELVNSEPEKSAPDNSEKSQ